jgi:hypothetical protein
MTHRRRVALALALALGRPVLPASASNQLIKVVEVFPGTIAQPSAQYVVLQMYEANENLTSTLNVAVYDATDTFVTSFTFANNVPNAAYGAKILIATPQADTLFGTTADLAMTASLPLAGGAVCWGIGTFYYDCFSWGSFVDDVMGGATGTGTPYRSGTGLTLGQAAVCDVTPGSPTIDAGDCIDSAADHDCGDAQPLANPVGSGPGFLAANPPCPVCGDDATNPEIGEQCDGTDDGACPGGCKLDCTCFTQQVLLGKLVLLKDPQPGIDPTKRKLVLKAKESASPSPVTGDPIAGGATLKITASGTTPSSQTFTLPGGAAFWTPLGSIGFKYKDTNLVNGPIKLLIYKKTGSGNFLLTVVGKGSTGALSLVPPNTATEARVSFIPDGGDRYCTAFGGVAGGTLDPNTDKILKAKNPTAEGLCPP